MQIQYKSVLCKWEGFGGEITLMNVCLADILVALQYRDRSVS